jgi:hypothetical protein
VFDLSYFGPITLVDKIIACSAVRKAKFFLHPDKLPTDFSEQQMILFKTLWEVINDSWEALEGP